MDAGTYLINKVNTTNKVWYVKVRGWHVEGIEI